MPIPQIVLQLTHLEKVFQSRSGTILIHVGFSPKGESLCSSSHMLMFVSLCD